LYDDPVKYKKRTKEHLGQNMGEVVIEAILGDILGLIQLFVTNLARRRSFSVKSVFFH
jgi:hypothetical protein